MQKFPSLLILGLAILVVALVQIGFIAVKITDRSVFNSPAMEETFANLPQAKAARAKKAKTIPPIEDNVLQDAPAPSSYIDWEIQPHNARLGNPDAPNQLIIATDTCRPAVRRVLRKVADRMNSLDIILKYVPTEPAVTDSGLLWQLASRAGLFEDYWQLVCQRQAEGYTLTLAQQVALLEAAGMTLTEQRTQMSMHLTAMLREINADNTKAQVLGLKNLPVFILNGRQVMPQGL